MPPVGALAELRLGQSGNNADSAHRHTAPSQRPITQTQPENAFRLELPVQGLHMVVVDDVVTTGSTVAEIAQLLLRNGAATVRMVPVSNLVEPR